MTQERPTNNHPQQPKIQAFDNSQVNVIGSLQTQHANFWNYDKNGPLEITVSGVGESPPNFEQYWVERSEAQYSLSLSIEQQPITEIVSDSGFGKSSLAAWAYLNSQEAFTKRLWVNFRRQHSFDRFSRWTLQEIGFPLKDPQATEEEICRELVYRLNEPNQPVKTLLVMDNLESVFSAKDWRWFESFLTTWASQGQLSRILLTTRATILSSCQIFLQGLTESEGSTFLQREDLTGENFKELVELTQGHPLLLKLAATWTKQTYNSHIDIQAIDFFDKLFAQYKGNPEAQVGEIFTTIFESLPHGAQSLLQKISVYQQPFDIEMAQIMQGNLLKVSQILLNQHNLGFASTLLETTEHSLHFLTQRGLLTNEGVKFKLHPLIESLINARRSEEITQVAHERALGYYRTHVKPWTKSLESCTELLEGAHHALKVRQYKQANQLLLTRFEKMSDYGYWRELLPLYERLTTAWNPRDLEETESLGWAWMHQGALYQKLNLSQAALQAFEQGLPLFKSTDSDKGTSSCLSNMGTAHYYLGNNKQAIELLKQAFELESQNKDYMGMAYSLTNIGLAEYTLGNYEESLKYQIRAQTIAQDKSYFKAEITILTNLGLAYDSLEKYEEAIECYNLSLKGKRYFGERWGEATAIANIALSQAKLGLYRDSRLSFEKAKTKYSDLNLQHMVDECDKTMKAIDLQRRKVQEFILWSSISLV